MVSADVFFYSIGMSLTSEADDKASILARFGLLGSRIAPVGIQWDTGHTRDFRASIDVII